MIAFRWLARFPVSCIAAGLTLSVFLATPPLGAEKRPKALTPGEIFKRVAPSVVAIDCLDGKNAKISAASGFFIADNGEIVTNFHVIKACQNLNVRLANGDVYDSTWVIAADARRDMAIIRIKAVSLPVLPLGESNSLEVGQTVYSVGNAKGLQNTLQEGLVSALREVNGSRLVQVSASINPGNSGGPIVDDQGRVIAIASAYVKDAENLGFAIPIDYLKGYLDSTEETAFSVFAAETNPASSGFEHFYKCTGIKRPEDVVDLGDTHTPASCLAACKRQDMAAGCWWQDGSGGLPRDCRVCKTLAPVKMSYENDWAIAIGTKSQGGVHDYFTPDAKAGARWIAPIFGQLLSFSFPFPSELKPAYVKVNGPSFIQESVPEGESADQWTQMITVTGAKGLASNADVSPRKFAEHMASGYRSRCPDSFSSASILDGKIGGYDGFAVVLSCGTSPLATGKSESVLVNVLKGDSDYYTVQWAERAEASSAPIAIDTAKWLERFKKLEPIKLCQIIPGESAPYPSCVESDAQTTRTATTPPSVATGRGAQPGHARADHGGAGSVSGPGGSLAHAKELLSAKRFSEALTSFRESASKGDAEAQRYVGDAYKVGWGGVDQDYGKARQWYEKAAAGGNAVAVNDLGLFYFFGRGVAQDYVKARELFEKAAASGNDDAMDNLGSLYQNGKGVAQDYAQARQWYEKGASAGNAVAENDLGFFYSAGHGVARDYLKARELFEKAAAAGNSDAMSNLGNLYQDGKGVAQDYEQARHWYEKGVSAGNAEATSQLGYLYQHGLGVAQDYEQARQYFEKSAAAGNADAMNNLGYMYERGEGIAADYDQARHYYEKASAKGNTKAMNNLGGLFYFGHGVAQDYAQARQWFEKAAAAGSADAMNNLGHMYEHGQGVAQDNDQARQWYEKAVAGGNASAKASLERLSQ